MSELSYHKILLFLFHLIISPKFVLLNNKKMIVADIVLNKCPRCKEGLVFQNSNLFAYKAIKMNTKCPHCQYGFIKEPGFYWGAMYVSYGLSTLEGIIAYIICRLCGMEAFDPINLYIVIATMLLFAPLNYRLSRLVWLYIFS